jgi:hypothetical protein
MKKIGLPLYMVQLIEIGLEKFDSLILTEEVVRNKHLMAGDNVVFHPRKMMLFPMDIASDG